MITVDDLAAKLAVDPGDVRVIAAQHGVWAEHLAPQQAYDVQRVLDPNGERTAPAALYWPGHPDWARETNSPTEGEGDYPPL